MAKFSFQVITRPGFQQVGYKFRAAIQKTQDQRRESMRVLGRALVAALQQEAPKSQRGQHSGTFAKGHSFKTSEHGQIIELRVYVPKPLGDWIRFGTQAHAIAARYARALRFLWEGGPRSDNSFTAYHFYKRVWHPGTKPNRYDLRAFQKWRPQAIVELRKMGRAFVINMAEK